MTLNGIFPKSTSNRNPTLPWGIEQDVTLPLPGLEFSGKAT